MRLLPLVLLLACCDDAPRVRALVERDQTGSELALAACLHDASLPRDACARVAARYADRVLARPRPHWLDCERALGAAARFAPERFAALAPKCCPAVADVPADRALCDRARRP